MPMGIRRHFGISSLEDDWFEGGELLWHGEVHVFFAERDLFDFGSEFTFQPCKTFLDDDFRGPAPAVISTVLEG